MQLRQCWISMIVFFLILIPKAQSAVTVKMAVLAPEGTTWATAIKEMSQEVEAKTGGKIKFKIYYGGVAGDEPDVLRKIRIGQLQGGVFTGRALGEINGDIRAMEIPFNFLRDRARAWSTLVRNQEFFQQGLEKKGFKGLGFFEIGPVYLVSTKKVTGLKDLKGIKIWSWEGDDLVASMIKSMNLVSVPLAIPDVLSSLTTGIVEAAYSSPLGILALQWNTKVKYIVDFPVTFSVGAFVIDMKVWNKIDAPSQKIIQEVSKERVSKANSETIKENELAIETMVKMGVEKVQFPESDVALGKEYRDKVVTELKGKLFSADAVRRVGL